MALLLAVFFIFPAYAQKIELKNFNAYEGMLIRNISVTVDDVFDTRNPDEDNWLFRKANLLKINTRESVIRAQLLFRENEKFDALLINETLRILEASAYLINADINVLAVDSSQVDVAVSVRDAWTLEPRISYGRDGGETKTGFGLGDGNLFGSGDSVMVAYSTNEEKNTVSYSYTKNNLFKKHIILTLIQEDNSDGESSIIRLTRPFYSLATVYDWGISSEKIHQLHSIKQKSEEINVYRGESLYSSVHAGYALHASKTETVRINVGVNKRLADFSANENTEGDVPASYDREYPWLEGEFFQNKFAAYRNLHLINRKENINLGDSFSLRLGMGDDSEKNEEGKLLRFVGHYASVIGISNEYLATIHTSLDSHYFPDLNRYESSLFSVDAEYHHFINSKNRWYVQLQYDRAANLLPHELLTLGGSLDLRGYPLAFQSGEERYVLNIERRLYNPRDYFNLFYVGALAFIDVGKIPTFENLSDGKTLADIGLGLRIIPSKLGNPLVVHLDLARPMIDTENTKTSYFSVSVGTQF